MKKLFYVFLAMTVLCLSLVAPQASAQDTDVMVYAVRAVVQNNQVEMQARIALFGSAPNSVIGIGYYTNLHGGASVWNDVETFSSATWEDANFQNADREGKLSDWITTNAGADGRFLPTSVSSVTAHVNDISRYPESNHNNNELTISGPFSETKEVINNQLGPIGPPPTPTPEPTPPVSIEFPEDAKYTFTDVDGNVNITGVITSGEGQEVVVKVYNPEGQMDYLDQTTSGEDGAFSFGYVIPERGGVMLEGDYTAYASGVDTAVAEIAFPFPPATPPPPPIEITEVVCTLEGEVSISGVIDTALGREVLIKVSNPAGEIANFDQMTSDEEGNFTFEFTIGNFVEGEYTIEIGGEGIEEPISVTEEFPTEEEPIDPPCEDCPGEWLYGDVNNDGAINVTDVLIVIDHLLYANRIDCEVATHAADLSGSGNITATDATLIIDILLFRYQPEPASFEYCPCEMTLECECVGGPVVTPEPTEEPVVTPEPTEEPVVTPEPTEEPVVTPEPTEEPVEPTEEGPFVQLAPPNGEAYVEEEVTEDGWVWNVTNVEVTITGNIMDYIEEGQDPESRQITLTVFRTGSSTPSTIGQFSPDANGNYEYRYVQTIDEWNYGATYTAFVGGYIPADEDPREQEFVYDPDNLQESWPID